MRAYRKVEVHSFSPASLTSSTQCGPFGEEKNIFSLPGIEHQTVNIFSQYAKVGL
jgi:hypothetical protein